LEGGSLTGAVARNARPGASAPVVGLDLAGSPLRRTGYCRLDRRLGTETRVLHTDEEILDAVRSARPSHIGIDAPLSLPAGRASLEIPGPPHFRACDRALRALGIRFFPLTLGPMRLLTARGIALADRLRREGYQVLETYPGGAQDVLGLPRKSVGERRLCRSLRTFGFHGSIDRATPTHDELDAVLCAYTALEHRAGRSLVLGYPQEGELVLPRPRAVRRAGGRRAAR
jgi:predicted nuclease with RNAse H fold